MSLETKQFSFRSISNSALDKTWKEAHPGQISLLAETLEIATAEDKGTELLVDHLVQPLGGGEG